MKDLVIIGAGDFGREVSSVVERINDIDPTWNLMGFVDDNPDIQGMIVDGYKVVGNSEWLRNYKKEIYAVCSLGESKTRKKVIEGISANDNIKFATLIDPNAILMRNASVQEGSIICAGTVLAINSVAGKHSILNLNCTVGHDTILGDYFTAHPGTNISGKVVFGEACYCGTGSKVLQGVNVISGCTFGAGAVVLKDVIEEGTYVGVPAKKI